jgi:TolA-binding protein
MESQDAESLFLFKVLPALEANKKPIIVGAVSVVVVVLLVLFFSWQRNQKEVNAGEAFSQVAVSATPNADPASQAAQYLAVAKGYPGTLAAQRAQLQGAADLFTAGRYADAQTQFQKFADTYATSSLISLAVLGVASSLDAQGNLNAASDSYRNVIENYGSTPAAISAKYALAGIYERQGKIKDAVNYYQEIARAASGTTIGQQAGQRSVELSATLPPAPTAPAPVSAPASTSAFPLTK